MLVGLLYGAAPQINGLSMLSTIMEATVAVSCAVGLIVFGNSNPALLTKLILHQVVTSCVFYETVGMSHKVLGH